MARAKAARGGAADAGLKQKRALKLKRALMEMMEQVTHAKNEALLFAERGSGREKLAEQLQRSYEELRQMRLERSDQALRISVLEATLATARKRSSDLQHELQFGERAFVDAARNDRRAAAAAVTAADKRAQRRVLELKQLLAWAEGASRTSPAAAKVAAVYAAEVHAQGAAACRAAAPAGGAADGPRPRRPRAPRTRPTGGRAGGAGVGDVEASSQHEPADLASIDDDDDDDAELRDAGAAFIAQEIQKFIAASAAAASAAAAAVDAPSVIDAAIYLPSSNDTIDDAPSDNDNDDDGVCEPLTAQRPPEPEAVAVADSEPEADKYSEPEAVADGDLGALSDSAAVGEPVDGRVEEPDGGAARWSAAGAFVSNMFKSLESAAVAASSAQADDAPPLAALPLESAAAQSTGEDDAYEDDAEFANIDGDDATAPASPRGGDDDAAPASLDVAPDSPDAAPASPDAAAVPASPPASPRGVGNAGATLDRRLLGGSRSSFGSDAGAVDRRSFEVSRSASFGSESKKLLRRSDTPRWDDAELFPGHDSAAAFNPSLRSSMEDVYGSFDAAPPAATVAEALARIHSQGFGALRRPSSADDASCASNESPAPERCDYNDDDDVEAGRVPETFATKQPRQAFDDDACAAVVDDASPEPHDGGADGASPPSPAPDHDWEDFAEAAAPSPARRDFFEAAAPLEGARPSFAPSAFFLEGALPTLSLDALQLEGDPPALAPGALEGASPALAPIEVRPVSPSELRPASPALAPSEPEATSAALAPAALEGASPAAPDAVGASPATLARSFPLPSHPRPPMLTSRPGMPQRHSSRRLMPQGDGDDAKIFAVATVALSSERSVVSTCGDDAIDDEGASPALAPGALEAASPAFPAALEATSPALAPSELRPASPAVAPSEPEATSPALAPAALEATSAALVQAELEGVSPALAPGAVGASPLTFARSFPLPSEPRPPMLASRPGMPQRHSSRRLMPQGDGDDAKIFAVATVALSSERSVVSTADSKDDEAKDA